MAPLYIAGWDGVESCDNERTSNERHLSEDTDDGMDDE